MNNELNSIDLRYRELAVSIVAQACADYCMSKRVIDNESISENKKKKAYKVNNDCIDFFNSDNYDLFSNFNIPADVLMAQLDKIAKEDPREFIRFYISQADNGCENEDFDFDDFDDNFDDYL